MAGVAGVLNIWSNGQIDPTSIGIGPALDLFIIAVIGGIMHLEGAWLGAFVFVGANIYLRDIPLVGRLGGAFEDRLLAAERFNTVIGAEARRLVAAEEAETVRGLCNRVLAMLWRMSR